MKRKSMWADPKTHEVRAAYFTVPVGATGDRAMDSIRERLAMYGITFYETKGKP